MASSLTGICHTPPEGMGDSAAHGILTDKMDMKLIDMYAHVGHWPFRRLSYNTPVGLMGLMERFCIGKALVSNFECILYRDVHDGNLDLWESVKPFSEKLLPAYVINPAFPGWKDDLLECIEGLKAKAIKLYPNYHGYSICDGPGLDCLREAGRLGLPVLVVVRVLDERGHHPLLLVPPVTIEDITMAAGKVPGTTLIACGAREYEISGALRSCPGLSNLFFEISNVASPLASIVALVELFGSSNLVFGTNMPLNYPGASIAKTVGPLYSKPDREAICYGNAQKILFRQVKGA